MPTRIKHLRAEAHPEIGELIERESASLIRHWADRSKAEQPNAARVHHDVLLDHLPLFLRELGRSLASDGDDSAQPRQAAEEHGDQRWDVGWSLFEVVRDYQILRVVLVEFLESSLARRLGARESLVLNAAIDDAIGASVTAYVESRQELGGAGADRAESHDLLLNVFGVVGHELRNPLAPLSNSLEILRLTGDDPAQVEQTRRIMERQIRLLGRLVDDLMDMPRLSRGKLTLRRERLDLGALVRSCGEERRAGLAGAGLDLMVDVPPSPVWVVGDEARLSQALGNLLGNAQKFTDRGGLVLLRLAEDGGRAVITVRDTGIGIEPGLLAAVFEAYMQADRSLDRSRGGLGLGLAIVKRVFELHGGAARVASGGHGAGTTFTVEVPLAGREAAARTADAAPLADTDAPAAGLRLLIVEDNADSAESLRRLLALHRLSARVAHTGPDAVAAASSTPFDVVLCDVGLPGMDGYAVAVALRGVASPPRLVVALTGHQPRETHGAIDPVFDAYLLKPVDPHALLELIRRSTEEARGGRTGTPLANGNSSPSDAPPLPPS